jgi:hypothetical protein
MQYLVHQAHDKMKITRMSIIRLLFSNFTKLLSVRYYFQTKLETFQNNLLLLVSGSILLIFLASSGFLLQPYI